MDILMFPTSIFDVRAITYKRPSIGQEHKKGNQNKGFRLKRHQLSAFMSREFHGVLGDWMVE